MRSLCTIGEPYGPSFVCQSCILGGRWVTFLDQWHNKNVRNTKNPCYLVGAQPSSSCSFARHLVGKIGPFLAHLLITISTAQLYFKSVQLVRWTPYRIACQNPDFLNWEVLGCHRKLVNGS